MNGVYYTLVWVALTLLPLITAWKRQWPAFIVYTGGWLVFLYTVIQSKDGWDMLADIATLIVVVIPVYLVASIIWLIQAGKSGKRK